MNTMQRLILAFAGGAILAAVLAALSACHTCPSPKLELSGPECVQWRCWPDGNCSLVGSTEACPGAPAIERVKE